jgi:hypothetical protein
MHLSASHKPDRLPKRFPIGTTYVVEGRGGEDGHLRVFSRYVVLPGGQRINLANDFGRSFSGPASPRPYRRVRHGGTQNRGKSAASQAKKISEQGGTTRQRRR